MVFGVSQSTISRMVNTLEEPITAVLDCEVPKLEEVIISRVIVLDGNLSSPPATAQLIGSCTLASAMRAGRRSRQWKKTPKGELSPEQTVADKHLSISVPPSNFASPTSKLEDPGHRISPTATKTRHLPHSSRRTRILSTRLNQL